MTFMLRDRPDGQCEIVINRPILIGIFPERAVAARVCTFLQDEAIEWPDDALPSFARAEQDVAEVSETALPVTNPDSNIKLVPVTKPARRKPGVQLPAVVDPPRQAAQLVARTDLSPEQLDAAFRRLGEGEKLATVAPDFGLHLFQLRGIWAAHKQKLQRHLAEGGQATCSLCSRAFTPSISNPDTCARCSHD